jgi:hypothetical protein
MIAIDDEDVREVCSDNRGIFGNMGSLGTNKIYNVAAGSRLNTVVFRKTKELRAYCNSNYKDSLAVAWMPFAGDPHGRNWNSPPNMYKIDNF